MKREIVKIKGIVPPPSPFNHVIRAGDFLFLSSQLSADLKVHKIIDGNISEQTKQALDNVKFLLETSGSSMENVIKVVIYMRDKNDFDEMNKVYREYFREGEEPARVTVQALSPIEKVDIEIEVTAIISD